MSPDYRINTRLRFVTYNNTTPKKLFDMSDDIKSRGTMFIQEEDYDDYNVYTKDIKNFKQDVEKKLEKEVILYSEGEWKTDYIKQKYLKKFNNNSFWYTFKDLENLDEFRYYKMTKDDVNRYTIEGTYAQCNDCIKEIIKYQDVFWDYYEEF
jgi:hypothetical protein